jgi:hypothetical protein
MAKKKWSSLSRAEFLELKHKLPICLGGLGQATHGGQWLAIGRLCLLARFPRGGSRHGADYERMKAERAAILSMICGRDVQPQSGTTVNIVCELARSWRPKSFGLEAPFYNPTN